MHHLYKAPKRLFNNPLTALYFIQTSPIYSKISKILCNGLLRSRFTPALALLFLSLWLSAANPVFAKAAPKDIPDNASSRNYGNGWSCNKGYRESKGACTALTIPANAYPTNKTYGQGWECKRGFKQINNTCKQIMVPTNGYLDYSGIRVKCNRGYILDNNTCKVIKVPENGYLELSSYGPGWTCDRGYRVDKGACIALNVPENAHIGHSGKVWECNKPYIKRNNKCILPVVN